MFRFQIMAREMCVYVCLSDEIWKKTEEKMGNSIPRNERGRRMNGESMKGNLPGVIGVSRFRSHALRIHLYN